jgi:hypothetical protein
MKRRICQAYIRQFISLKERSAYWAGLTAVEAGIFAAILGHTRTERPAMMFMAGTIVDTPLSDAAFRYISICPTATGMPGNARGYVMPKIAEDNESRLNELRTRLAALDRERTEIEKLIDQITFQRTPKADDSELFTTPACGVNQNSANSEKIAVACSAAARMSFHSDGKTQRVKKVVMRRPAAMNGSVEFVKNRGSSALRAPIKHSSLSRMLSWHAISRE